MFTVCPQPWVASLNQEDALPLNISWPLSEHRSLDTSKGTWQRTSKVWSSTGLAGSGCW